MIKQNVNIVNFNTLYVILEEIKENLHFNIIKYESDEDFYKMEKNILKDSLIITNSNNKTISDKNLLIFNNLPIIVSIGQTSHGMVDECVSMCLRNFSREFKIKSHFSQ